MNGKWTYYHKNGQMYGQGRFKDGERDGLFTYWHENGEKKEEGIYKKGKKYGEWTYWYENGQNRKITYKDGTPLSKMATITMMVTANVRAQLDPCG
jgi:antitoxin component YwqK of YwqJK toxin-antitoxin module